MSRTVSSSHAFHWGQTGMTLYSDVPVPSSPVSSTS